MTQNGAASQGVKSLMGWLGILLLLTGCVSLRTSDTTGDEGIDEKPRTGNYYFLPKGLLQIDGVFADKDKNDFVVTVKVINVPDPTKRFFLRHRGNPFSEDKMVLKVNAKGLLETVSMASEDKTPVIIDKITESLIDVARIGASGFSPLEVVASPLKTFHVVFDPFRKPERDAAIAMLKSCGVELDFPSAIAARKNLYATREPDKCVSGRRAAFLEADGALYRPPTAIELSLKIVDATQVGVLSRVWVRLPDPNAIAVMNTNRAFLVKRETVFALVDGDLIQVDHTKPSQALALVSIPASVIHKVAEAIPGIIEIEDKRATRVPPELAAQKARLDAEAAVINSKAALQKARTDYEGGTSTDASATPFFSNAERPTREEVKRRDEVAVARAAEAKARQEEAEHKAHEAKVNAEAAEKRALSPQ